jgi:hypothetical protein
MTHSWNRRSEETLRADLEQIFGPRLGSIVAYETHFGLESAPDAAPGPGAPDPAHLHTLVLVESLTLADLVACAARAASWTAAHAAVPLIFTREEFGRSLDAFPLEIGAIASHHVLVAGSDPFDDLEVDARDVRRACETQAKSHLVHLREGFLEARAEPAAVARLVAASVPAFRTLLLNLVRLDGAAAHDREALVRHVAARIEAPPELLERVLSLHSPGDLDRSDSLRVYAGYLDSVERLTRLIDGWKRS